VNKLFNPKHAVFLLLLSLVFQTGLQAAEKEGLLLIPWSRSHIDFKTSICARALTGSFSHRYSNLQLVTPNDRNSLSAYVIYGNHTVEGVLLEDGAERRSTPFPYVKASLHSHIQLYALSPEVLILEVTDPRKRQGSVQFHHWNIEENRITSTTTLPESKDERFSPRLFLGRKLAYTLYQGGEKLMAFRPDGSRYAHIDLPSRARSVHELVDGKLLFVDSRRAYIGQLRKPNRRGVLELQAEWNLPRDWEFSEVEPVYSPVDRTFALVANDMSRSEILVYDYAGNLRHRTTRQRPMTTHLRLLRGTNKVVAASAASSSGLSLDLFEWRAEGLIKQGRRTMLIAERFASPTEVHDLGDGTAYVVSYRNSSGPAKAKYTELHHLGTSSDSTGGLRRLRSLAIPFTWRLTFLNSLAPGTALVSFNWETESRRAPELPYLVQWRDAE
jgi:hypothetical protein